MIQHHGFGEIPGSVEMIPTRLPELPKPARTPGQQPKPMIYDPNVYRKNTTTHFLANSFKGPY